jgi:hypothetical protein
MAALRQKLPLERSKSNFRFTPENPTQLGYRGMSEMCRQMQTSPQGHSCERIAIKYASASIDNAHLVT